MQNDFLKKASDSEELPITKHKLDDEEEYIHSCFCTLDSPILDRCEVQLPCNKVQKSFILLLS